MVIGSDGHRRVSLTTVNTAPKAKGIDHQPLERVLVADHCSVRAETVPSDI